MMRDGKIKSVVLNVCLTLVCASFAFSQTTKQQTPESDLDVPKLVRESFANQMRSNWRMSFEYTYKWLTTIENGKGKIETSLRESYFPSRVKRQGRTNSLSVLLAKNGAPVAPAKIEKERREISEKLEKAAAEPDDKSKSFEEVREKGITYDWLWNNVSVGMNIFLGRCRFDSPSREIVDGRAAVKLRFQTCSASGAPESYAYLLNIRGEIWIDEADKMTVRFEAYAKNPTLAAANQSESPAIVFTQKKVAEGFWFPTLISIYGAGNETVFPNLKTNRRMEFFDYKQSQTEVREVKVGAQ